MRFRPIGLLLSGVVVASSACSIDATSPSAPAVSQRSEQLGDWSGSFWIDGGETYDDGAAGSSSASYTVRIDPQRRNVLRFGPHTLEIPPNAICDGASGYGLESFDRTCTAEQDPVTIGAVVRQSASGVPRIDLMPDLRFSPMRTVTLTMYVPNLTPQASAWTILYCATRTTEYCIDESALDPSLATHVNYGSSTLFRRIKHFSGYFVLE